MWWRLSGQGIKGRVEDGSSPQKQFFIRLSKMVGSVVAGKSRRRCRLSDTQSFRCVNCLQEFTDREKTKFKLHKCEETSYIQRNGLGFAFTSNPFTIKYPELFYIFDVVCGSGKTNTIDAKTISNIQRVHSILKALRIDKPNPEIIQSLYDLFLKLPKGNGLMFQYNPNASPTDFSILQYIPSTGKVKRVEDVKDEQPKEQPTNKKRKRDKSSNRNKRTKRH